MGNPALYIDGNNNWIFKNGLHDVVGSKPAGVFGYKIQGTKIGLFGAVNDFSLFEVGNGYVEVTEIEKSATPNDFYSDINEFLTACKDFFLKATAGGGGTDTNIYNTNGTITEDRLIEVPNGNLVKFFGDNYNTFQFHAIDGGERSEINLFPDELFFVSSTTVAGVTEKSSFGNNGSGSVSMSYTPDNANQISISASANGIIVEDAVNNKGIEEKSDYSANYTDTSLVNKKYVDDHVVATTLQGAIDNEKASVGGYIDVVYGALHLDDDGGEATLEPNNYQGIINFKARHINISTIQRSSSTTDDAKIIITDDRVDKKGVEYYADYSDSFGAYSLIDKNFAENKVFFNKKRAKTITSNYTINPVTDEVINIGTLTADITVTIPLSSILPTGFLFEYWIYKTGSDGFTVTIQLSGTEKFPLGYSKLILLSPEEFAHIGGGNGSSWSKLASQKIVLQAHRTSNWNASNFNNDTAIPFEHADVQDNDEIFKWDIANNTRLTSLVGTRINGAFIVDIDSTGGGTWTCEAFLRKNGTDEIEGSRTRTGNYGGEDQSQTLIPIAVNLNAGDYIEVVLNHNNLTGRLANAICVIDSLL